MICESSSFTIIAQTHETAPTIHTTAEILLSGARTQTLQKFRPGSAEKPGPLIKAFRSRSPYLPSNQQSNILWKKIPHFIFLRTI